VSYMTRGDATHTQIFHELGAVSERVSWGSTLNRGLQIKNETGTNKCGGIKKAGRVRKKGGIRLKKR